MSTTIPLHVNGRATPVTVDDPDMPLLYALRDNPGIARAALRLRPRAVWFLHRAPRRQGDSLLRDASLGGRQEKDEKFRRGMGIFYKACDTRLGRWVVFFLRLTKGGKSKGERCAPLSLIT
jgi:hypothetical protein